MLWRGVSLDPSSISRYDPIKTSYIWNGELILSSNNNLHFFPPLNSPIHILQHFHNLKIIGFQLTKLQKLRVPQPFSYTMDRIFYVSEDTYLLTSYIQIGTRFYYILILLHVILVPCEVCNTLNFSLCKIAMKSKHLLVVCFALFLIFITDYAPLQTKKLITVMMGCDF